VSSLRVAEQKISNLNSHIDGQNLAITERDNEIERLKKLLSILDDMKAQRDALMRQMQEHQEARDKLSKDMDGLIEEARRLRQRDQAHFEELMEQRRKTDEECQRKEQEKNEKDIKIKNNIAKTLEMQQRIDALESMVAVKDDVSEQLSQANGLIEKMQGAKEKIQRELDMASDYLLEQEDKTHKANTTAMELLKQLKDAEGEIEGLKQYIIELKQRISVYIPVRDDPIDKKLAEYINNYPERSKLKIMFMRESEGVYQFGSKRVCVRVDKDKINIRVGGGYLSIDEFLDIYTPQELERLERRDPLKKFSEKVVVQKTCVGNEVREDSPIRQPRGSPTRRSSPKKKVGFA